MSLKEKESFERFIKVGDKYKELFEEFVNLDQEDARGEMIEFFYDLQTCLITHMLQCAKEKHSVKELIAESFELANLVKEKLRNGS